MVARQPSLFIPHGGGPCFFMEPRPGHPRDLWDGMAAFLRGIKDTLPEKPRAVLVISGHWEEDVPTVQAAEQHSLFFDYYNFPPHTYQLTYPAAGDPALAGRVRELLAAGGFESAVEEERGLDHGVFVPFKLVFPDADIPVVQLSMIKGWDPEQHIALGRALAPLRDEGVLIVGSGMSFHNLRIIFTPHPEIDAVAAEFDRWLARTMCDADIARRDEAIAHWEEAPGARLAHPREEHLVPAFVAAGAGGEDVGQRVYSDVLMGKAYSGFRFG